MNSRKITKSLKQIAKNHNINKKEIRQTIETAISISKNDLNTKAEYFWKYIPCKDSEPTIEEVISYIAYIVKEDMAS